MLRFVKPALVLTFLNVILSHSATGQVVYRSAFTKPPSNEWSTRRTDVSPKGDRHFLGQFGAETARLSLGSLPEHTAVTISFDLLIINTWDGNSPDNGPDVWELSVDGGPVLLHTTFTNLETLGFRQAYPDTYGKGDHPGRTGAIENNTLGYPRGGDSIYHISFTFPHTGRAVTIEFSGIGLQPISDESWGLDNVEVSIGQDTEVIPILVPPLSGRATIDHLFTGLL